MHKRQRAKRPGAEPTPALQFYEAVTNADRKRARWKDWIVFALASLVGVFGIVPGCLSLAGHERASAAVTVAGGALAIALAVAQLFLACTGIPGTPAPSR